MLLNAQGKQVTLKPEASDYIRKQVREVLAPLPHKGHAFFRLEERAVIKGQ